MKTHDGKHTHLGDGDQMSLDELSGVGDGAVTISFRRDEHPLYFVHDRNLMDDKIFFDSKELAVRAMNVISMVTGLAFTNPEKRDGSTIYTLMLM